MSVQRQNVDNVVYEVIQPNGEDSGFQTTAAVMPRSSADPVYVPEESYANISDQQSTRVSTVYCVHVWTSDVKRGQNLEAEAEAEAKA